MFRTVIWRNRAGGQPWLTAFVWPGSPLPSAEVPHSRYVERPPTPSHDAQKSGVRDWYAASFTIAPSLPFVISRITAPPNWKL